MLNSHYFFKKDNYIETQKKKVKKPNGIFFFLRWAGLWEDKDLFLLPLPGERLFYLEI